MSISFRKRLISHLKFLGHLFAPITALVAIIGGIYTFYTKPWQPIHKALSEIVELLRPPAERARIAAAEQAKRAEEQARIAAAEQAKRKGEERARIAAAEQAKRDAEEQARIAAAEQAKRKAEERARIVVAEQAKREAEEQARLVAAEQAKREAEERARIAVAEQPFNGIWNVTWKGVSNCSSPNWVETYVLHIRDGHIFVANRDYSGRVSSSGVVQWGGNATKYGGFVQYDGVLSGSSGEGRFQNTKGCRGTFTARKRQAVG